VTTSGLRREPVQARSRARLARVVAAAEALIVREGVGGLTMRRLADEAGVPIGSVYQFFVDREAVLAAIVAKHGTGQRRMLEDARHLVGTLPWLDLVDDVFDRQCARLRDSPAYVALWVARALSPDEQRRDDADVENLADLLAELIVIEEGVGASEELKTRCRVAVQSADALLHLAFRVDPAGHPETLAQAKTMLRLYLAHAAEGARSG
jgi:AcrR family transcriptional regulator